jgi:hypothetical protein
MATSSLAESSTSEGFDLPVPDEPQDGKTALRAALLDGQPWGDRSSPVSLSEWLWGEWGADLEPLGFGRDRFDGVLDGSAREARLWVLGDRQWTQLVSGLVGRISRRLPAAPAS